MSNLKVNLSVGKGERGSDGLGLDYQWRGTELGVKKENESEYKFVDLQGKPGGGSGGGLTQEQETNINKIPAIESQLEEMPKQYATKLEVGSPLTASNISGMVDKAKVYVNTTDGNWYSWNGTAWTIGGKYNSQGIGDKSITPIKTTFMEETAKSSNLFNYETVVLGKYLSASSGEVRDNVECFYSDYISVISGQNYTITECYNTIITYYNSEKAFTSGVSIGNNVSGKTLLIPDNTSFIRLSLKYIGTTNANYDYTKVALCKGNTAIYEPFGSKTKLKDEYIQTVIDDISKLKENSNSKNNFYKVVSKTNGDYKTVTEAVLNSKSGDTIVVTPGVYEDEIIEAWGKTISVIGVSKRDCIIKNSTGDYHTPPLEASSGLFKNLTIIHEKKVTTTGVNGYAIHIEDNDTSNKNLVFENCYIESQNNWAIGMGTRGGCYVEFKGCDLIGADDTHGGLFFHDSAIDEYLGVQTIRCIDTNIFSKGSTTTDLKIQSQNKTGSTVNVEFIRCNIRNLTNGKQTKAFLNYVGGNYTNANTISELVNFNLSKGSYGNNMTVLNYT